MVFIHDPHCPTYRVVILEKGCCFGFLRALKRILFFFEKILHGQSMYCRKNFRFVYIYAIGFKPFLSMKIKILIADPHPIVCVGIKTVLAHFDADFAEAHDYPKADEILSSQAITIAIMESKMAGLAFHQDLYKLPAKFKRTRFIVHTEFFGSWLKDALLESKFHGLVSKKSDCLSEAATECLKGMQYLSPELRYEEKEETRNAIAKPTVFTRQEIKVLCLSSIGMSANHLSYALDLKKNTIHSYRKALIKKFKVKNMAELVDYAHRIGLL